LGLQETEQQIKSSRLLVGYFSHDECQVCKVLKPKVKALVEEYPGTELSYINIKELPQISGQYLVFAVPTLVLFSDGKEQRRYSRHFSVEDLRRDLDKLHTLIFG